MDSCKSIRFQIRDVVTPNASLRSRQYRFRLAVALIAGTLLLSGCAAPEKPLIYVEPGAASQHYSFVIVAGAKKGATTEIPTELLDRTSKRLAEQLRERGFSVQADRASVGTQDYLLVNSTMEKYEGGSAVGRWFGFGAGAAICALRVELLDGQSGKRVGDAASTQTIEGGGLYTIGAENYIVDRCADSVASGIAEKLPPNKARN